MAANYSKRVAVAPDGNILQEYGMPLPAIRRITSENATVSSVVTLNDNTTNMEIAAVGAPAAIKWVATTDTEASIITIAGATSNYDAIIPAGTVRKFLVPREGMGSASVVGANIQNGLYRRVAWKTSGVGSILSTEY